MQSLSWPDRFRYLSAFVLVKTHRLEYDFFTQDEINALVQDHLDQEFSFKTPVGTGQLTIVEGTVTLGPDEKFHLQLLCSICVMALGSTIYRAHCVITLSAKPSYSAPNETLTLEEIGIDNLHLLNDEYALIRDTQFIIDRLLPLPVSGVTSLLSAPIRSTINLLSGGSTESALAYLKLYIHGNKQRILQYHQEQIEQQVLQAIQESGASYQMDHAQWRQRLFARLGQSVSITDNELRFWF